MFWEDALVARLNAAAGVGDAVDADADGDAAIGFGRNRGAGYPALLLAEISLGVEWTHDGPVALEQPRVQFDSYAADAASAKALSKAVRAAMEEGGDQDGWRFHPAQIESEQTIDEGELTGGDPLFRVSQDFVFYIEEIA